MAWTPLLLAVAGLSVGTLLGLLVYLRLRGRIRGQIARAVVGLCAWAALVLLPLALLAQALAAWGADASSDLRVLFYFLWIAPTLVTVFLRRSALR